MIRKYKVLLLVFLCGCKEITHEPLEQLEPKIEVGYRIIDSKIEMFFPRLDLNINQIKISSEGKLLWKAECRNECSAKTINALSNDMKNFSVVGNLNAVYKADKIINIDLLIDVGAMHIIPSEAKRMN